MRSVIVAFLVLVTAVSASPVLDARQSDNCGYGNACDIVGLAFCCPDSRGLVVCGPSGYIFLGCGTGTACMIEKCGGPFCGDPNLGKSRE